LVFKNQGKNLRTQETLVFFKKSVVWVGEKDENQQKTMVSENHGFSQVGYLRQEKELHA
jgi:hypothetical protein